MIVVARGILGRAEGQPKPAPRRLVIDDCVTDEEYLTE